MVRKLPWKIDNNEGTPSKKTAKREGESPRPQRATPTVAASTPRHHSHQHDGTRIRSPSTSPPPEPPAQQYAPIHLTTTIPSPSPILALTLLRDIPPPADASTSPRLMIPGASHDDKYRLVEDELLHTARLFTTHLHRAEYNRLKLLAKAQNAATIREIERPVVPGPASGTAKRRREEAAKSAKQRRVLKRATAREQDDDEGEKEQEELPWVGTSLQGLMETTPRREMASLAVGLGTAATGGPTRAAAGVGAVEGRRSVASRERDGFSSAVRTPASAPPRREAAYPALSPLVRTRGGMHSAGGGGRGKRDQEEADYGGDDDPFGLNRRRVRREKSRDQMRRTGGRDTPQKLKPDTIPSFF